MTYDFQTQKAVGGTYEHVLDEYFSAWFEIQPVTGTDQKQGIDRVFIGLTDARRITVEYKTDLIAARTGNAFVELSSGVIPGWVYTSSADRIFYFVPGSGWDVVYILKPSTLRRRIESWRSEYPTREVVNTGYKTVGLLVPLAVFEALAMHVVSL